MKMFSKASTTYITQRSMWQVKTRGVRNVYIGAAETPLALRSTNEHAVMGCANGRDEGEHNAAFAHTINICCMHATLACLRQSAVMELCVALRMYALYKLHLYF